MKHDAARDMGVWQTIRDALTLNPRLSKSVQGNQKTRRTAFAIVLLAALSRSLGSTVISLLNRATLPILLVTLVLGIFTVIIGYYFWTFTIWKLGQWSTFSRREPPGTALTSLKFNPPTYRELLIPVGFAYSPQILDVVTIIPLFGRPIELILAAWTLLAVTIAVHRVMRIAILQAAIISFVSFPVIQIVSTAIQVMSQQFRN
ncbi:hypothetical protein [Aliterella atlantica]|uniref:Yip1 domain-containing protein n=1 Tax=Aliterella atlantica CENA595 TaxID=1618023 RepID=A0A0D8ZRC2_9CYAN|nr:hypothetical protein [Aliterella atlantica]KJH71064.1 hypothetical protein UH38_14880 [Aliterella atlantica CENA595]